MKTINPEVIPYCNQNLLLCSKTSKKSSENCIKVIRRLKEVALNFKQSFGFWWEVILRFWRSSEAILKKKASLKPPKEKQLFLSCYVFISSSPNHGPKLIKQLKTSLILAHENSSVNKQLWLPLVHQITKEMYIRHWFQSLCCIKTM